MESKEKSGNIKILIVEDNIESSGILKNIFQNFFENVYIDSARNGLEGLNFYKNSTYDIVFTDIRMPMMDGVEMIRKIKKLNQNQSIVIISAFDFSDLVNESSALKVDYFIQKPITKETLLKVISHYK